MPRDAPGFIAHGDAQYLLGSLATMSYHRDAYLHLRFGFGPDAAGFGRKPLASFSEWRELYPDAPVNGSVIVPNMRGWDLTGADFGGCDLSKLDLSGACLANADLREADMRHSDLTGADFRHADLRGADLRSALVKDAIFEQALIKGSSWTGVALEEIGPGIDLVLDYIYDKMLTKLRFDIQDLKSKNGDLEELEDDMRPIKRRRARQTPDWEDAVMRSFRNGNADNFGY